MAKSARPTIGNGFLSRLLPRRIKQNSADRRDAKNAEQNSDEPEIQFHIAIQDMAELVADDALQFVARQ